MFRGMCTLLLIIQSVPVVLEGIVFFVSNQNIHFSSGSLSNAQTVFDSCVKSHSIHIAAKLTIFIFLLSEILFLYLLYLGA